MKRILASLLLALGLALMGTASAGTVTAPFSQIIVFGDSLSDTGNVFAITGSPPAPYFNGRFSNGPVWADVASDTWGIPLTNYAHGGALTGITNSGNALNPTGGTGSVYDAGLMLGTAPDSGTFPLPGMVSQVLAYATGVQILATTMNPMAPGAIIPDPGALYVVFAGANDFLAFNQSPQTLGAWGASVGLDPFDPNFVPNAILKVINLGLENTTSGNPINYLGGAVPAPAGAVPILYTLGARNIVVVNLPDLSLTPAAAAAGPELQGAFLQSVNNYNRFLAASLASLRGALPGVNIIEVDLATLTRAAVADPASFGLSNVTDSCVDTGCFLMPGVDPNTYLFWDGLHPTSAVHAVLASEIMARAEASLAPPPPPVLVPVVVAAANGGSGATGPWMLLIGLFFIGLARRRPTLH